VGREGPEGAAAPAGLELQLGRGAWRAAHGPTAWRAVGAGRWGIGGRRWADGHSPQMGRGAEGAGLRAVACGRVGMLVLPVRGA